MEPPTTRTVLLATKVSSNNDGDVDNARTAATATESSHIEFGFEKMSSRDPYTIRFVRRYVADGAAEAAPDEGRQTMGGRQQQVLSRIHHQCHKRTRRLVLGASERSKKAKAEAAGRTSSPARAS